jgi:hypothetical protein
VRIKSRDKLEPKSHPDQFVYMLTDDCWCSRHALVSQLLLLPTATQNGGKKELRAIIMEVKGKSA